MHVLLVKLYHNVKIEFNFFKKYFNTLHNFLVIPKREKFPQRVSKYCKHVYVAELKYLEHSQSGCAYCGLIT